MEIWGVTLSTQTLFFFMLVSIGILTLVFSRNHKYNQTMLKAIARELETALQPQDQTYTWLGGSVGFRVEYETAKPLRKVEATATMLSRQSVFFYPISKLLFGNDRLFIVCYPVEKFRREAHILEHWYYTLRLRTLENEAAFLQKTITVQGKTFHVFSSDKTNLEKLAAWISNLPAPRLVKHLAFAPENGTLYLYMIPRVEALAPVMKALFRLL